MTDCQSVIATSDLHLHLYAAGDASVEQLIPRACASDADVLIVAGDVTNGSTENFAACLMRFQDFKGTKLLVPGNHDLWTSFLDSRTKYETLLPEIAAETGFHVLDKAPFVMGRTAFIGNIGWYDYSLRSDRLNMTLSQYRSKTVPGVCTWNDKMYVKWDLEDDEFTQMCLDSLQRHYAQVEPQVDQVVVVLHHLPFVELVHESNNVALEFCRAYMGSSRFGELLLECPKVRYVICGHRHSVSECTKNGVKAMVIGSEYSLKRMLTLNLVSGEHAWTEFPPPEGVETGSDDPADML